MDTLVKLAMPCHGEATTTRLKDTIYLQYQLLLVMTTIITITTITTITIIITTTRIITTITITIMIIVLKPNDYSPQTYKKVHWKPFLSTQFSGKSLILSFPSQVIVILPSLPNPTVTMMPNTPPFPVQPSVTTHLRPTNISFISYYAKHTTR